VIEELLPAGVVAVETTDDLVDVELLPEELAALGRPVEKRRREFVTGRACARQALERLGVGTVPVARGDRGQPLWPAGVVGSITHCDGYRACAVARSGEVHSLGIDAEPRTALPDDVLGAVASPLERARLGPDAAGYTDMVLFSAKEAVYKAWFPLTGRWLGFEDVDMSVDTSDGTFRARLLVEGPELGGRRLTAFDGRWRVDDSVVVTAVAVEWS
jgi:4'-phosphopantetheinyl transferase EntD